MDVRQLYAGYDLEEVIRSIVETEIRKMPGPMPCKIVSFDGKRAAVQPQVKAIQRKPDGTFEQVSYPVLADMPVNFPGANGLSMTWPLKPGDEVWWMPAARSLDSWDQSGGEQSQTSARSHSLSDGFILPGGRSKATSLSDVSGDAMAIRSDDGQFSVSLTGSGVTLSAGGVSLAVSAGGVAITGGTVSHDGINIGKDHLHTDVESGGSLSGPPQG